MTEKIVKCRICGNERLLDIFNLGEQSLASQFPAPDEPDPMKAPLHLVKCDDKENHSRCGLLQLSHTVASKNLYSHKYGYRSGINSTMPRHLEGLVREIEERIDLQDNDIVVDIGSNDCTLLKAYSEDVILRKIGIDPIGSKFLAYYPKHIHLSPHFFSKKVYRSQFGEKQARVVTSISMFYDLPDPLMFAKDVKAILADDGIWVTEQSYCVTMIEKTSFDTICHEHLEYYTFKQIAFIAHAAGLQIVDVSLNECNGGSFRISMTHKDNDRIPIRSESIASLVKKEEDLALHTLVPLHAFVERCQARKDALMSFLTEQKNIGKSIYIYGASTKGNTLLQYYGLDNSLITAAAERNPDKYGCRTPHTNIPIVDEKTMRDANPDFLLVLPWHFRDEFVARETEYIESGGTLIFPLPTVNFYSQKKKH
uniref:Methyltransf_13 and Methyltransf_14 domain-containing protein n=1 Tax=Pithovirus LCPAC304 TaxID=2506594 RepID=A0A481Z8M1_9VIRU|nr:MAG: Methyltransf_13 and Methyltransf_14 domain-containing protein [Pithovirus LCPAC304]